MSGDDKQTTTASQEPWKEVQPLAKLGISDATGLYKSGELFKPWTGSGVVPYSDRTTAGVNDVTGKALTALSGPNAFDDAFNFHGNTVAGSGLSTQGQEASDMWGKTARGEELGMISPDFQRVLDRSLEDANTNVALNFSGMGRYGSPEHSAVTARETGDLAARMRVGEYERQMGRMDNARGNYANIGQQGMTNRSNAASALPGAWGARQLPAQDLMKAGAMDEDLAGRVMSDNERLFREQEALPRTQLEWLSAFVNGTGRMGGSSTSSTKMPTPNPLLSGVAAGIGFNNMLGNPLSQLFASNPYPGGYV